ncbi:MAG TPA: hypothetical protein V6C71_09440 [Coleofasciculaceae cyanobacterium]|jgi:hypothetical protein
MEKLGLINLAQPKEQSVLFITLDSCRYDTFLIASAPNLKALEKLYRAMAPGNFTYSSHAAMFVGFTPGVSTKFEPYVNSKYGKIFKILNGGLAGKAEHFILTGRNIIDGFKRRGYLTIGSGAVGWFDPKTETGQSLIQDFEAFFYPGNTFSLDKQIQQISQYLENLSQPVFVFLMWARLMFLTITKEHRGVLKIIPVFPSVVTIVEMNVCKDKRFAYNM